MGGVTSAAARDRCRAMRIDCAESLHVKLLELSVKQIRSASASAPAHNTANIATDTCPLSSRSLAVLVPAPSPRLPYVVASPADAVKPEARRLVHRQQPHDLTRDKMPREIITLQAGQCGNQSA